MEDRWLSVNQITTCKWRSDRQPGICQEELACEPGVSFATINRRGNGKTMPFKLARKQFDAFCEKMTAQGKLRLGKSSEK